MTSYQGGLSFSDTGALRVTTAGNGAFGVKKIGLIGDSLMLRGLASNVANNLCTLSIISATEVQVTQTNYRCTPGNKVMIQWADQPLLNGYCTAVLRIIDSTNFTIANPGITGTYPISVGTFAGKANIGCFSLTNIRQIGFVPWIMATQPDTYFTVFSVNAMEGATSTQVDTYCATNAVRMASLPDEWWYLTGANDVGTFTVAQTMANVVSTMNKLLATGKTVRLFTPNAYDGTASYSALLQEIRQQQIETYKNNPQVILFDLNKWMINPLSLTGNMKTGYSQDGVHPSVTGCYQAGKGFWSDMKLSGTSLLPQIEPLFPVSQIDSRPYANAVGFSNLAMNPMLIGTAGSVTGTGASGQCADNWAVTNNSCDTTVCTAQVARTDSKPGYFNQIVATKASGTGTFDFKVSSQAIQTYINSNTVSMGAGWYVFGFEVNFTVSTGSLSYIQYMGDFDNATANTQVNRFLDYQGDTWVTGVSTDTLAYISYPFYVGVNDFMTGTWNTYLRIGVTGGSSTINIGRPFCRRITV